MAEHIKHSLSMLGKAWCRTMHRQAMWPIHGEYYCSICLRRYPVPWEHGTEEPEEAAGRASHKVPQIA
jgi:hypothetical protein